MQVSRLLSSYKSLDTIVHVGAHLGQELTDYLSLGFKQIIYIEADPELFSELSKTIDKYGLQGRVHAVNALVTCRNNVVTTFYVYNEYRGPSSIYKPAGEMFKLFPQVSPSGKTFQIRSTRLDTLLMAMGLNPSTLDVLVVDVQGAEYSVLLGAGVYLIHPMYVEVEVSKVPLYEGGVPADQIVEMMRLYGYVPTSEIPDHDDMIFINKNRFCADNYQL